jgi:hypothetical protein
VIHPDVLLASLTSRQWQEWVAFHQISPVDRGRFDVLAAMVRQAVLAAGGAKNATLERCMPVWHDTPKAASLEKISQTLAIFRELQSPPSPPPATPAA